MGVSLSNERTPIFHYPTNPTRAPTIQTGQKPMFDDSLPELDFDSTVELDFLGVIRDSDGTEIAVYEYPDEEISDIWQPESRFMRLFSFLQTNFS